MSGSTVTGKILGAVGLADTVGLTLAGLSDQMATVSTSGSNGTISGYYFPPKLTGKFMELADENLAEIGRPLCTTKQINSLSGFVLCRDGDFSGAATAEETAQINTFMTSGFYYE